jgi:hypothetical protein
MNDKMISLGTPFILFHHKLLSGPFIQFNLIHLI